jgi:C4-dicarboxylate transporter DctM subunit
VNLFVASSISGVSIERLSGAIMPFFAGMILLLLAITFIPAISLTLVSFW